MSCDRPFRPKTNYEAPPTHVSVSPQARSSMSSSSSFLGGSCSKSAGSNTMWHVEHASSPPHAPGGKGVRVGWLLNGWMGGWTVSQGRSPNQPCSADDDRGDTPTPTDPRARCRSRAPPPAASSPPPPSPRCPRPAIHVGGFVIVSARNGHGQEMSGLTDGRTDPQAKTKIRTYLDVPRHLDLLGAHACAQSRVVRDWVRSNQGGWGRDTLCGVGVKTHRWRCRRGAAAGGAGGPSISGRRCCQCC